MLCGSVAGAWAQDVLPPLDLADGLIGGEIDPVTANYAPLKFGEADRAAARERIANWIRAELCDANPGQPCDGRPARAPGCEWEAINLGWGAAEEADDLNAYTAALIGARAWLAEREAELAEEEMDGRSRLGDWRDVLSGSRIRDQYWRRLRILMQREAETLSPTEGRIRYYMARAGMCRTDRESAQFARDIFETHGWPRISEYGADVDENLWLLVQHAPLSLQREVLPELERLYPDGETSPRNYALLFDRVMQRTRQPQRYGSQYTCQEGEHVLYEVEDPETLDLLREEMGLQPIEDAAERRCSRRQSE